MRSNPVRIDCAGLCDGVGIDAAPGSILLTPPHRANAPCDLQILAAGPPGHVERHPDAAGARRINLPADVLFPALVNAHTHLDLTHLGHRPFDPDEGFTSWVRMIREGRLSEPDALEASVRLGVERSLAGAVVAVGDIAGVGAAVPLDVLRRSPLEGVSYFEFFGTGARQDAVARRLRTLVEESDLDAGGVRLGLQPHAPYSVGIELYTAAADLATAFGLPITTHLAETPEEFEFVADAAGPLRDMLEELGVWDERSGEHLARSLTPIRHLLTVLRRAPFTLAHVNHIDDAELELLAAVGATVVYCPRAHAYFGHERRLGPHPWRRLLAGGVQVALGTDSAVSLAAMPNDPQASERLTVLDDMRFLRQREQADPQTLLRLGTTAGARALGMNPDRFTLAPGPVAGIGAVSTPVPPGASPSAAILDTIAGPRLLEPRRICPPDA